MTIKLFLASACDPCSVVRMSGLRGFHLAVFVLGHLSLDMLGYLECTCARVALLNSIMLTYCC